MVLTLEADANQLRVKAGIFFQGVVAGCSCSDDPSPTDVENEYAQLWFLIDRVTARTQIQPDQTVR